MAPTKLLLIRHGQTDDNWRRVYQGHAGRGLDARGREQASLLAARLARSSVHLDALYCSDLERAQETAAILGAALSLTPVPDPELREVHLGAWQGLSFAEVEARFPEEHAAWRRGEDIRRGGGETYAELGVRLTRALTRIAARHDGGTVAIVSHGAAIKTFTALALGIAVAQTRAFQVPTNTGVCLFERTDRDAFRLLVWNDAAHLGDPIAQALA
ncbi:histidine phosphatase family protein [Chondromyces apiculatus]|uniref:Phosphoglycerate mutase n=1 Tax=Chondromyces apiculatus DSM 436 TaxID=1192034 RepID=A0A017TB83_9BACT|nr:histidine phosphatase family protein [Chondromyces apiculatus]EYF06528.1 Phosphoglycerate mutase [Chondromyces apiculatus DSM 436]